MAAAAIKVASAAQGNHKKNKNHHRDNQNYVAPDDGEEKAADAEPEVDYSHLPTTGFFKYQKQARIIYTDNRVEIFVAVLIGANFVTNIVEKTVDPSARQGSYCGGADLPDEETSCVWWNFGLFYNVAFTIELAVNMYAFWLKEFWNSGWNVFDFIVVAIGIIGYVDIELGPFALLRMMRAFRVFRLFKRVKSLNKILVSLARAIPGVCNAFLIMLIVMCIYAILGVEFYKYEGTRCTQMAIELGYSPKHSNRATDDCYLRDDDNFEGGQFGAVYFGNFMKSLYTLFQVLTGDSWSEAIGRPLMVMHWYSTLYFVSFILINAVVLINVVVAVLLEKMVDETPEAEDDDDDNMDYDGEHDGERLDKLETSVAHLGLMLEKLLEAQHIAVPPRPTPKLPVSVPGTIVTTEPKQEEVVALTKDSGGGPSRVDYTDPKDDGLLPFDGGLELSAIGDEHDSVHIPVIGC